MFSVSGRCCPHAMNCSGTPFSGSCCVRSSLSGTFAYSWHTLLRVCTSFMYSCRLTISACAWLTCSMLRANRTTKVFCTCVVVGGSEVASSSGLAWARRMQLPPMPFSCSSLSPLSQNEVAPHGTTETAQHACAQGCVLPRAVFTAQPKQICKCWRWHGDLCSSSPTQIANAGFATLHFCVYVANAGATTVQWFLVCKALDSLCVQ